MKVLILGGGISGLAAAWFVRKQSPDVNIVLLERQKRLGGWIETERHNNFLFEMGPRTFQISRSIELLGLIGEVGLEKELIFSSPAAKSRYIFHRNKVRSIGSLWPQLLWAVLRDLFAPKGSLQEESIHAFACRRFGSRAAALFFDPLAKGIFGGDISKLSLDACFPTFRDWEQEHRSIIKAMMVQTKKQSGLFTLRGGMQTLIDALAHQPIEIHTGCGVESIGQQGVVAGGKSWDADLIISALPGSEVAKLCGHDLALTYESLSVVALGYCENVLPKQGYGYLVPSIEGETLLGQIWDSCIFPIEGQTKVTSMVRGEKAQEVAIEAMWRHLGVFQEPEAIIVKKTSIPQYEIGHKNRIELFESNLKNSHPKLKLVGNYLEGPSVEACVRRAKKISLN